MAYIDFRVPPADAPTHVDRPRTTIRRATVATSDCRTTTRLSYLLSAALVLTVTGLFYLLAFVSIRQPVVAAVVTIALLLPAAPLVGADRSRHR